MEDPANLMMISGVMVFGAPIEMERLRAAIEQGLLPLDRFGQRIVRPAVGKPYWEDDPDLDLDYHLQRISLPPPGNQATLQELASLLASRQLDFSRPLWQLHLVEPYGDGCALICRLHHCIGDGLALVHVLLSLTTTEPDEVWPESQLKPPRTRRRWPIHRLYRPARAAIKTTVHIKRTLVKEAWGTVRHPSRVGDWARTGLRGAQATARLLLLWPDPNTIFKGPLDIPKRVAWSQPLDLQEVKSTGHALGSTINDILLAAMSGALRRYLEDRGEPVAGLNFRAVVPVNLRKPGTEHELGNKFGLVFLSLPIGIVEPEERLRVLKQRMDELKESLEAPVAFGILTGIGSAPGAIQDVVVNIFGAKGTAVMTNVIGPREQIYLAGAPLESLMFWVPQSGRLGMGVSILSYNGQVYMGVITDQGLVPDPESIIDSFHAEFEELVAWSQQVTTPPTLPHMLAQLDETIEALDELLDQQQPRPVDTAEEPVAGPEAENIAGGTVEEEPPQATEPAAVPERCQALTKSGRQCKNPPQPGSDYCHVHQPG
jgi:WS/DGAT/MGAT family acyltransferase